jgi:hypothetical protein
MNSYKQVYKDYELWHNSNGLAHRTDGLHILQMILLDILMIMDISGGMLTGKDITIISYSKKQLIYQMKIC